MNENGYCHIGYVSFYSNLKITNYNCKMTEALVSVLHGEQNPHSFKLNYNKITDLLTFICKNKVLINSYNRFNNIEILCIETKNKKGFAVDLREDKYSTNKLNLLLSGLSLTLCLGLLGKHMHTLIKSPLSSATEFKLIGAALGIALYATNYPVIFDKSTLDKYTLTLPNYEDRNF